MFPGQREFLSWTLRLLWKAFGALRISSTLTTKPRQCETGRGCNQDDLGRWTWPWTSDPAQRTRTPPIRHLEKKKMVEAIHQPGVLQSTSICMGLIWARKLESNYSTSELILQDEQSKSCPHVLPHQITPSPSLTIGGWAASHAGLLSFCSNPWPECTPHWPAKDDMFWSTSGGLKSTIL